MLWYTVVPTVGLFVLYDLAQTSRVVQRVQIIECNRLGFGPNPISFYHSRTLSNFRFTSWSSRPITEGSPWLLDKSLFGVNDKLIPRFFGLLITVFMKERLLLLILKFV